MAGYPFSADPLSGIWYPPGWIGILIHAPYGYNLSFALHLLWGGLGMAFFLSRSGLKKTAAVFGGIAFAAMPKLFAHLALGHASMVFAVAWFPWLLLAELNRIQMRGTPKLSRYFPGIILGIIALADIRSLAYAFFLYISFWLWSNCIENRLGINKKSHLGNLRALIGQIAFCLGIGAVQIIPLIQFTSLSTRMGLSTREALAFSLPLKKVLNIFIPEFGGYAEWIVYPGAVVAFLCILVIAVPALRKRLAFWLLLFAAALLISFGSNLPLLEWLGGIPGANLMRVPPRMMFVAMIALIILASHAYYELISGLTRPKFDPIFSMVAISAFFCALIVGSLFMKAEIGANFIWGTASMLAAAVLIGLTERQKIKSPVAAVIFPLVLLIDLIGVNSQSIQYRNSASVFQEGSQIVEVLKQDTSAFRVYSPNYSFPQLAAARAGIGTVSAINPLQLAAFSEYLALSSGVQSEGYSVTIPPLDEDNMALSNIDSQIDAKALGRLNVKYVIASYPIENLGLIESWSSGSAHVYKNAEVMPRAWIEDETGKQVGDVKILKISPGNIVVEAHGLGNLILSEADYPGWNVKVNQKPVEKLRIDNLFLGVKLDAGQQQVEFYYQPLLQFAGIAVSVTLWLIILVYAVIRSRK